MVVRLWGVVSWWIDEGERLGLVLEEVWRGEVEGRRSRRDKGAKKEGMGYGRNIQLVAIPHAGFGAFAVENYVC